MVFLEVTPFDIEYMERRVASFKGIEGGFGEINKTFAFKVM